MGVGAVCTLDGVKASTLVIHQPMDEQTDKKIVKVIKQTPDYFLYIRISPEKVKS